MARAQLDVSGATTGGGLRHLRRLDNTNGHRWRAGVDALADSHDALPDSQQLLFFTHACAQHRGGHAAAAGTAQTPHVCLDSRRPDGTALSVLYLAINSAHNQANVLVTTQWEACPV